MIRFCNIGITTFLWCAASLLLAVFTAIGLESLYSIQEVGEKAGRLRAENLPEIFESQRSIINIESLRRLAEQAYLSESPKTRRAARIEAQALAAETVFGRDEGFHRQALDLARKIALLVRHKDAAQKDGAALEKLARNATSLQLKVGSFLNDVEAIQEMSRSLLDTSIVLSGNAGLNPDSVRRMIAMREADVRHTALVRAYCARHAAPDSPLRDACDRLDNVYAHLSATQDRLKANFDTAYEQWQEVDHSLKIMRDNVSNDSEFVTRDALTSIEERSAAVLRTSIITFGCGLAFFILYLLALHLFIVRPARWIGHKLQQLREGVVESNVPDIRIVEFRHVAELLDRFGEHLTELTSHATRLAEDAAGKQDLEALMTAVFQVSVDGYMVWDTKSIYTINTELMRILGFTSQKQMKRHWKDLHLMDRHQARALYDRVMEAGLERAEEYYTSYAGEKIPFEVTNVPLARQGRQCVLSYFRDLRLQKRTEEMLRLAKEDAEAASRVKGEFLARMSHEIRTPMNGVLGLTHVALSESPPPAQRMHLEKIQASARILLGVINDILDFSKMESGRFVLEDRRFSLAGMLTTVTDLFRAQAEEKGLAFTVNLDSRLPASVSGDELRLSQVLLNLLGNAVKFTDQGGVALDVALSGREDRRVRVRFAITDNGLGMTDEQLSRLFQPFAQADTSTTRKYGGTGLGLVISQHLVEMMHGTIEVDSEPGRGSTFRFTVLLGEAAPLPEDRENTPPPEHADLSALRGKRILLVEDNEINQEVALSLLRALDLDVHVAGNGQEALSYLDEHAVDAILMDIQMPVMDGLTAAGIIRREGRDAVRNLPIIAMTAHAMREDRDKSLAVGMNDHLTKPIDVTELQSKLSRWLGPDRTRE